MVASGTSGCVSGQFASSCGCVAYTYVPSTAAERARKRWAAAGLEPITLHECRHTYASFLMAAGYTLRELMEYMGHSSLQATERYVKLLPPLDETDPAERLNAYLRRRASQI